MPPSTVHTMMGATSVGANGVECAIPIFGQKICSTWQKVPSSSAPTRRAPKPGAARSPRRANGRRNDTMIKIILYTLLIVGTIADSVLIYLLIWWYWLHPCFDCGVYF